MGSVVRLAVFATVFATLFAGTVWAQQTAPTARSLNLKQAAPTARPLNPCRSARGAAARLICADPDLAALDSILTIAFRDAQNDASLDDRSLLAKDQLAWTRERNQKCGLIGKDYVPLAGLRPAKQCVEDAIEARIAELQDDSQTGLITPTPAPIAKNVVITPVVRSPVSIGSGESSLQEPSAFQQMRFGVPADGIGGIIDCSISVSDKSADRLASTPLRGKSILRIAIDDDANSYRTFENDAWAPLLDNLRTAAHSACANALKTGKLRNAANEQISDLSDMTAVSSAKGLFVAYSTGLNTPWILQANLPMARKKVKSDLGIQTWLEPSQLTRNPYFFKGSVVGMIIQFDHMISQDEAVFTRPGAQIFVSGVSSTLFQDKEMVVLAGRVIGNKGVISPSGSEALLPALDYVGAYKCDNVCDGP